MVSLTTGSLSSLQIGGALLALLFVYVVNMQREFDKRIEKLEKEKFDRRTEENHQESDGRT